MRIRTRQVTLEGALAFPESGASGVVLFAHGSGRGRRSRRNGHVASMLRAAGLATLLLDLLTSKEEQIDSRTNHLRFDVDLLGARLIGATGWLQHHDATAALPIGYLGIGTGAGAALIAAAQQPGRIGAVVSLGGRPDLAGPALEHVRAPTLLVVGGDDDTIVSLNRGALGRLGASAKQIVIVPGAAHLFVEKGTLDEVARLAVGWFARHLEPRIEVAGGSREARPADRRSRGRTMLGRDRGHALGRARQPSGQPRAA